MVKGVSKKTNKKRKKFFKWNDAGEKVEIKYYSQLGTEGADDAILKVARMLADHDGNSSLDVQYDCYIFFFS